MGVSVMQCGEEWREGRGYKTVQLKLNWDDRQIGTGLPSVCWLSLAEERKRSKKKKQHKDKRRGRRRVGRRRKSKMESGSKHV